MTPMAQDVRAAYAQCPADLRDQVLRLRELVISEAEALGVGPLTETLKWGEPAYLTERSRAGTTVRIGWKDAPLHCALYVHCRTSVIDTVRTLCPQLTCDGNRAITFNPGAALPEAAIRGALGVALTYHQRRRAAAT